MSRIIAILAVFLTSFQSVAAPTQPEELESYIRSEYSKLEIPGLAFLTFDSNGVRNSLFLGMTEEQGVPISLHTPFAIGSISKSFTAIAVQRAVEQGRISLSDKLSKFVNVEGYFDDISLEDLLKHQSGFSTYQGNLNHTNSQQGRDALLSSVELAIQQDESRQSKGKFWYSNLNYQLLGYVLERVYQLPFEEIIQAQIFDVLNMSDSFVGQPQRAGVHFAQAHRFWFLNPVLFPQPIAKLAEPQGGIYTSAQDLMLYLGDLMSEKPRLLTRESADLLWSTEKIENQLSYGLGWFVRNSNNGPLHVFHGGLNAGYKAEVGFVPREQRGFILLTNASDGFIYSEVTKFTENIRNISFGEPIREVSQFRLQNIAILSVVILLAIAFLLSGLRFVKRLSESVSNSPSSSLSRSLLLYSFATSAVAWLLAIYVPQKMNVNLAGIKLFHPDIGWIISIIVVVLLVLSVLAIGALIRLLISPRSV